MGVTVGQVQKDVWGTTKERRGILKTAEGLIQLRQCPICLYLVKQADALWKRKPIDVDDMGEIASCRFCHEA